MAFLLAFGAFLIVITPLIIINGGYYFYYGDYNSQQIPFYIHSQEFVKTEGLGWDWGTDLGANFVGSYSFYLLGSPFFWLTLLLPNSLVVFSMPLLLAAKFGMASLTAYAFIRRFVRSRNAALIGAMLYAFSGFQMFNIFFNHFHDVTAFFPLMLIALEESVNNNRKGIFAASVALMGIINYFFFVGQAVFLVMYLLMRLGSPDFKITWKKFFYLAIEAVIGVMIACVMFIPSALAILGNYRVSERLYGINLVAYSDATRIPRIIQSFFMIPDIPARPNLFSSDSGKWASIGGYLPLFSMAGVIAFMKSRKNHWTKRLIFLCILFAFVPVLNSLFFALNSSYYARWFYMPILIMALMTAQAFDDRTVDFSGGIKICVIALDIYFAISFLPKIVDEKVVWAQFSNNPLQFYITLGVTAIGLGLLGILCKRRRKGLPYMKQAVVSVFVMCIVSTCTVMYFGAMLGPYGSVYKNCGIYGGEKLVLEEEENQYFRVDMCENYDNYPMFWGRSSMRAFQSIVPGSIMEFYDEIDIQRDVASRAPTDKYTIRGLFSVKYYFDKVYSDKKDSYTYKIDLPGFEFVEEQNGFYVYENKNYIPMGFTFDHFISDTDAASYTDTTLEKMLIRALVLDDKQIEKYSDVISELPAEESLGLNSDTYIYDCEKHAKEACESFIYDSEGFDAEITLDTSKLVFFSVPYDEGWTAYVNGKPADIEKVSYGFMAVKAEEGENKIEFRYETPGLKLGFIITLSGLVLLGIYMLITRKQKRDGGFVHFYDYDEDRPLDVQKYYISQKLGTKTEDE